MKEFIRKYRLELITTLAGLAGGFLYWKFVGCTTGTCPIKSVWYWSTLYGGLIGYLLGSIVKDIIVRFSKKKDMEQS